MAERKKQKTKRRDKTKDRGEEPTKEEYAIAKYVRFNCPTKSTLIMGNDMHYFTASKAVDCLINSKWASEKAKIHKFTNRQSCVDFMQRLLEKSLLFRAKKLVRKRKDRPTSDKNSGEGTKDQQAGSAISGSKGSKAESQKRKDSLEKSPKAKKRGSVDESKENDDKATDEDDKEKKDKKKPKKIKFEFHPEQIFVDGNDIYVWKYDPTSTKTFLLGLGIVVGAIGVCLFPLWPPQVRLGVYYLSLVAMGFVGVIISLVILRSVMFGVIWASTWGKHHFWLLPNLTEDCGFFESFKPLYSHKVMESDKKTSDSSKKEKKAKESDKESSDEDKDKEEDIDKEESEDDDATKNGPTDTDRLSDEESEEENN